MEIFRIAPLAENQAGMRNVEVVTKKDTFVSTDVSGGLEIKVAILPEEFIQKCSTLDGQLKFSTSGMESEKRSEYSRGKCLATWLLHQATMAIDNVFEDWYESFARKKGFDPHQENVRIANPCNQCMERVKTKLSHVAISSLSEEGEEKEEEKREVESKCYVFTSLYTAQVAANHGESLTCPSHGTLQVADVAPDLVSNSKTFHSKLRKLHVWVSVSGCVGGRCGCECLCWLISIGVVSSTCKPCAMTLL